MIVSSLQLCMVIGFKRDLITTCEFDSIMMFDHPHSNASVIPSIAVASNVFAPYYRISLRLW